MTTRFQETTPREARRSRQTKETSVSMHLVIDGKGKAEISTGIGFLDHMLELVAHHGRFDLSLDARGDLHVDPHHTVEDIGLVLGDAFAESLGDKVGVTRFGAAHVPLDEALSRVVVDLSGRPFLHWQVDFSTDRIGDVPTELFEDFFRAFSDRARVTLHIETLYGRNNHHKIETVFKAFARAVRQAVSRGPGEVIPSTKGTLED
jgi:imidazoleglycerol-phosphate dehydratase